jgi:hypothetical protein
MKPKVTLTPLEQLQLRQKTEEKTHFGPELDETDCPDCPQTGDNKQARTTTTVDKQLPAPDFPQGD